MSVLFTATDLEGDTIDVLDMGDTILLRRNSDEGQTVELTDEEVAELIMALSNWMEGPKEVDPL